ncbi:peptidylprolyl isomerase [Mariniluteicoccus flavus]
MRVLPIALAGALLILPTAACSADGTAQPGSATSKAVKCSYPPSGDPAKPVDPPSPTEVKTSGQVKLTMNLGQGPVTFTMDRSATPCTAHSFESLVKQGYFDDTACHRLVDSGIFVLQCGDPTGTGRGGPGYRFADELKGSEKYPAGTVAMANAGANTNGSQFFFVYKDSPLPPKYTAFGQLDEASLGVVARIAAEGQDGSNPDGSGKPNGDAKIATAKVTG